MTPDERFTLTLVVLGEPAPKGSGKALRSRSTGKPIWVPANKRSKPYEACIASEAHLRMGSRLPFEGPVEIFVQFFMPRPKSAPKRVVEPITRRGDIDKLLRCALDGLVSGGALRDDSQVIHVAARKAFAGGVHDPQGALGLPRAIIRVEECEFVKKAG